MSRFLIKMVSAFILWGIFIFTILQIPYPQTLIQAQAGQLLWFFLPLFLALVASLNLFLKNIFLSCSISLGLISLLILKALDVLNLVTGSLIVITVGLLISYFRKVKVRNNLTKFSKIPKLTHMRKRN